MHIEFFSLRQVSSQPNWNRSLIENYDNSSQEDTDSEEEDNQIEESFDPSQDFSLDAPFSNYTREAVSKLHQNWGGKFSTDKVSVIHGWDETVRNTKDIKFLLNNDLGTTWLQDPTIGEPEGEGFWSKENLSKLTKSPWVPKEFCKQIPKRLPVKFEHKNSEKYFSGPVLAPSGKNISLPSIMFSQDTVKMPVSDNHQFEYYGRQSVFDCEITHNLLDLNSDIISSVSEAFNSLELSDHDQDIVSSIKESFVNLADSNRLAIQSNYRAKSFSIANCTKAKLNMRESVLNKFKGDNSTKESLRGSNFFTNSLFGPLPNSLMEKLDTYSNRSEAKLTPIPYSQKFNNKRKSVSNPFRPYNKPKRVNYGNYHQYDNSSNRGGFSQHPYSNPSSSSTSRFATNSLFRSQPRPHRRGRGHKRRGSRN